MRDWMNEPAAAEEETMDALTDEQAQALVDALSDLAEDVPPMPEEVHARWTAAVREEAEAAKPARKGLSRAWIRALTIAAVLVYIIGGTLLTRGRLSPREVQLNAAREQAAARETIAPALLLTAEAREEPAAAETGETPDTADAAVLDEAPEPAANAPALLLADLAEEPAAEAVWEEAVWEEAAEEAPRDEAPGTSGFMADSPQEAMGLMLSVPAAEEDMAPAEDMEEALPEEEPAPAANSAPLLSAPSAAAAGTPMAERKAASAQTAQPTLSPTLSPPPLPPPLPTAAPTARPDPGRPVMDFLADAGRFLLWSLPFLAAAGILAGGAAWLRRRSRKKGGQA